MTALNRDRNTPLKNAELIAVPMAADCKVFAGALVVGNAAGFAAPGHIAPDLTYLGRAEEFVDNSKGNAGAAQVLVRRNNAFKWANDGSITQAHLMKTAYIIDDQTVAATDDEEKRSAAGRVVGIEADGVWIE